MREVEAEEAAFIAASCLGIDNQDSALYVQAWHGDGDKLEKSAVQVLGAAEKIVRRIMREEGRKENA